MEDQLLLTVTINKQILAVSLTASVTYELIMSLIKKANYLV